MAMDTSKLLMLGGVAVGGYFLYESFFATPAVGAVTPTPGTPSATGSTVTTSPAAPSSTSTPVSTPAAPAGPSLASIWTSAQASAMKDPNYLEQGNGLTPYQWNFYISYVQPAAPGAYAGTWPPDPQVVFPGVNLSSPMSAATYWAGMQKAMQQGGLSGLLAGLGCWAGMGQTVDISDAAGDMAAFNASGAAALLDPNAGPNFTGGIAIPSSAPGGQANLTALQVATGSPALAGDWFSQNSGLLIAGGLAIGALFLIPNINKARR